MVWIIAQLLLLRRYLLCYWELLFLWEMRGRFGARYIDNLWMTELLIFHRNLHPNGQIFESLAPHHLPRSDVFRIHLYILRRCPLPDFIFQHLIRIFAFNFVIYCSFRHLNLQILKSIDQICCFTALFLVDIMAISWYLNISVMEGGSLSTYSISMLPNGAG